MSFKFNFDDSDVGDTGFEEGVAASTANSAPQGSVGLVETYCPDFNRMALEASALRVGNEVVDVVSGFAICREFFQKYNEFDVVPGEYEGGLKIWEGSVDLGIYIFENNINLNYDSVFELGCGHGVPTICAMLRNPGLTHVYLSDFNAEVLQLAWCNLHLNFASNAENNSPLKAVKTFAGDWTELSRHLHER
jgi:hypothetical protein